MSQEQQKYWQGNFTLFFSAYLPKQLKNNNLPEIAFFGRSNVGKSSLINGLTRQKNLAKTSKTPGRTASINFFINQKKNLLLVDLPGYGYAAANKTEVKNWQNLISYYLNYKQNIKQAFTLIDSRRGVKDSDRALLDFFTEAKITFSAILTKSDKLSGKELENIYNQTITELEAYPNFSGTILNSSSLKKTGIAEIQNHIIKSLKNDQE